MDLNIPNISDICTFETGTGSEGLAGRDRVSTIGKGEQTDGGGGRGVGGGEGVL